MKEKHTLCGYDSPTPGLDTKRATRVVLPDRIKTWVGLKWNDTGRTVRILQRLGWIKQEQHLGCIAIVLEHRSEGTERHLGRFKN